MNRFRLFIGVLALLAIVSLSLANAGDPQRTSRPTHIQQAHVIVTPDQIKWGPGPPALPAGSQLAIIEGDPSKAGALFTIRAKLPDGYKIPPHWHPTDERVTVLQGSFGMGVGAKFDTAAGQELTAGSYASMPMGTRHYAWAVGETIIQVSAIGPFEVNYVNAADDPRKAKP